MLRPQAILSEGSRLTPRSLPPSPPPGKCSAGQREPAAALEMHLQPGGRQGHIPDMSWLNKAIYQHRVDTAELGTESQRALAPGPRNTQRAWGELGTGKVSPALAPRQETDGHRSPSAGRPRASRLD